MTSETLPQPPFSKPTHAEAGLRGAWAWLQQDHGIWTDIVYGAIPLVPMIILLAIPGSTLLEASAEYALFAVLVFVGLFLHGAWRHLRSWYRHRAAKS